MMVVIDLQKKADRHSHACGQRQCAKVCTADQTKSRVAKSMKIDVGGKNK